MDPKHKNLNLIDKNKFDVIFNALHGKDGEDGIAQSYFEYLKIPYTHSGVISSFNSMNKIISKEIFSQNKILTPKFFSVGKKSFKKKFLNLSIVRKKISFPIVVKPIDEGSSIGVKISANINNLYKSAKNLYLKYDQLIFEE